MMATTHALVGATIMKAVPDPLLAGGLILASHYLLDIIPHWDFGTDWKGRSVKTTGMLAIADTLFAFLITFILFWSLLPPFLIFMAVSLANLPDWMIAPYFMFFSSKEGYHKSRGGTFGFWYGKFLEFEEEYLHRKTTFLHGVLTQIGTIIFFYLLLV